MQVLSDEYRVIYIFIKENLNEKCPSFEHCRNLL